MLKCIRSVYDDGGPSGTDAAYQLKPTQSWSVSDVASWGHDVGLKRATVGRLRRSRVDGPCLLAQPAVAPLQAVLQKVSRGEHTRLDTALDVLRRSASTQQRHDQSHSPTPTPPQQQQPGRSPGRYSSCDLPTQSLSASPLPPRSTSVRSTVPSAVSTAVLDLCSDGATTSTARASPPCVDVADGDGYGYAAAAATAAACSPHTPRSAASVEVMRQQPQPSCLYTAQHRHQRQQQLPSHVPQHGAAKVPPPPPPPPPPHHPTAPPATATAAPASAATAARAAAAPALVAWSPISCAPQPPPPPPTARRVVFFDNAVAPPAAHAAGAAVAGRRPVIPQQQRQQHRPAARVPSPTTPRTARVSAVPPPQPPPQPQPQPHASSHRDSPHRRSVESTNTAYLRQFDYSEERQRFSAASSPGARRAAPPVRLQPAPLSYAVPAATRRWESAFDAATRGSDVLPRRAAEPSPVSEQSVPPPPRAASVVAGGGFDRLSSVLARSGSDSGGDSGHEPLHMPLMAPPPPQQTEHFEPHRLPEAEDHASWVQPAYRRTTPPPHPLESGATDVHGLSSSAATARSADAAAAAPPERSCSAGLYAGQRPRGASRVSPQPPAFLISAPVAATPTPPLPPAPLPPAAVAAAPAEAPRDPLAHAGRRSPCAPDLPAAATAPSASASAAEASCLHLTVGPVEDEEEEEEVEVEEVPVKKPEAKYLPLRASPPPPLPPRDLSDIEPVHLNLSADMSLSELSGLQAPPPPPPVPATGPTAATRHIYVNVGGASSANTTLKESPLETHEPEEEVCSPAEVRLPPSPPLSPLPLHQQPEAAHQTPLEVPPQQVEPPADVAARVVRRAPSNAPAGLDTVLTRLREAQQQHAQQHGHGRDWSSPARTVVTAVPRGGSFDALDDDDDDFLLSPMDLREQRPLQPEPQPQPLATEEAYRDPQPLPAWGFSADINTHNDEPAGVVSPAAAPTTTTMADTQPRGTTVEPPPPLSHTTHVLSTNGGGWRSALPTSHGHTQRHQQQQQQPWEPSPLLAHSSVLAQQMGSGRRSASRSPWAESAGAAAATTTPPPGDAHLCSARTASPSPSASSWSSGGPRPAAAASADADTAAAAPSDARRPQPTLPSSPMRPAPLSIGLRMLHAQLDGGSGTQQRQQPREASPPTPPYSSSPPSTALRRSPSAGRWSAGGSTKPGNGSVSPSWSVRRSSHAAAPAATSTTTTYGRQPPTEYSPPPLTAAAPLAAAATDASGSVLDVVAASQLHGVDDDDDWAEARVAAPLAPPQPTAAQPPVSHRHMAPPPPSRAGSMETAVSVGHGVFVGGGGGGRAEYSDADEAEEYLPPVRLVDVGIAPMPEAVAPLSRGPSVSASGGAVAGHGAAAAEPADASVVVVPISGTATPSMPLSVDIPGRWGSTSAARREAAAAAASPWRLPQRDLRNLTAAAAAARPAEDTDDSGGFGRGVEGRRAPSGSGGVVASMRGFVSMP